MRNLKIMTLFITLLLLSGCGEKKLQGNHYSSEINVDGSYGDWSEYSNAHVKSGENGYLVSTAVSDSFLYFMFRFNDQRVARLMARRGLYFWISVDGKKDKNYGVSFQSLLTDAMRGNFNPQEMRGAARKPISALSGDFYWRQNGEEISLGAAGVSDLAVATAQNNGIFCFEYAVPLHLIGDAGEINKSKLMVGLEIPGVSEEMRNNQMTNMNERGGGMDGGMRGGGRGGGRGGRSGGGGPSGGRPDKSTMQAREIWLRIELKN